MRWRGEIEKALYGPRAMRFVSTSVLLKIAQNIKPSITDNTLHSWINEMTEAGELVKVYRSLYANMRAHPPVVPPEACQYMYPGAVVSLQYVLGAFGIINNPPRAITFVAPIRHTEAGRRVSPMVRTITGDFGEFRLHALPERMLDSSAGVRSDLLDPTAKFYARATPEKALVDWIYLAASPRSKSKLTMPPFDTDVDDLDLERLMRIARNTGTDRYVADFLKSLKNTDEDESEEAYPRPS